jgi:hypothetical protein
VHSHPRRKDEHVGNESIADVEAGRVAARIVFGF